MILTINFNDLPLCEGKRGRDLIFCNYFNCHPVVLFRAAGFAVRWEKTPIPSAPDPPVSQTWVLSCPCYAKLNHPGNLENASADLNAK